MYSVSRSALVAFSNKQMFELVNDIDGYKDFLPWCGDSKVLEQSSEEMVASVTIDFKGLRKTFTTHNSLTPYSRTELKLVDGPFSELLGRWEFVELEESACKVVLNLDFNFSNVLVGKMVGPIFKGIADSMVDSFCDRANEIYGEGTNG